jgi:hypothetical protein
MSDTTLNCFVASGTAAEMAAFTPNPPVPAAGPDPGYMWYQTDTGSLYSWDGAAWQAAGSPTAITALTGDVTATGPGSVAATIAANAVTNTKLRDSGALSVIGRSANSGGDPADISAVAASDSVLRESGSTVGFGTIATGGIANDAITYAKIQNISATQRVLGRNTAGAGDTEEVTFTQFMDWVSGAVAQGDIIYRNGTTWVRLAAGTSGFFLQTQGAGANPQWAQGATFDLTPNFLLAGM